MGDVQADSSKFFAALSSPLRIRMIQELSVKSMEVNKLVHVMGRERTLVSKNLKILLKARLVRVEKRGKHRRYHANMKITPLVFKFIEKISCETK
ncbi:MAG: ArsR/SmtB family transcription factor [Candidatus Bilamarchaeum sp.]|jgi:DNA-binding transcriptional ArsR family regulator